MRYNIPALAFWSLTSITAVLSVATAVSIITYNFTLICELFIPLLLTASTSAFINSKISNRVIAILNSVVMNQESTKSTYRVYWALVGRNPFPVQFCRKGKRTFWLKSFDEINGLLACDMRLQAEKFDDKQELISTNLLGIPEISAKNQ